MISKFSFLISQGSPIQLLYVQDEGFVSNHTITPKVNVEIEKQNLKINVLLIVVGSYNNVKLIPKYFTSLHLSTVKQDLGIGIFKTSK